MSGFALVLGDTPDSTTLVQSHLGPVLLRWVCADSEADILDGARRELAAAQVMEELKHQAREENHLLIDSAWSGTHLRPQLSSG